MSGIVLVLSTAGTVVGSREVERTASMIRQFLTAGPFRVVADCAARRDDLRGLLAEHTPNVVHVSGPGGELLLDGRPVSPQDLAAIFARDGSPLECVLLNSYFTIEHADGLLEVVRSVIGTAGADGEVATRFWRAFYDSLGRGAGYASAFEHGRRAASNAAWTPRYASSEIAGRNSERRQQPPRQPRTRDVLAEAEPIFASARTPLYPLWFATNRAQIDADDPVLGFSAERDAHLHYGTCYVAVPRSHRIGSIGSTWWKRLLSGDDDRLRLRWETLRVCAPEAFWHDLSDSFLGRDHSERMALVVIHGYNVSFEVACLRAAQIGFDLHVPGATAFFSWPSRARLAGYLADAATIQASEAHIAQFLLDFTRRSGAEAVHVIAHSMGNRGLLRAMQRIVAEVGEEARVPFGQLLLAAPDEDRDVFVQLSSALRQLAHRTTLYVSARDRAVAGSTLLHDSPRVGFTPPVTVIEGIDTVEVANADVSLLGHGYIAEARDLLHDVHSLIVHDAPPSERMGLRPAVTREGEGYWVIGA